MKSKNLIKGILLVGGVAIATVALLAGCGKKKEETKTYEKENEVIQKTVNQVNELDNNTAQKTVNQVNELDKNIAQNTVIQNWQTNITLPWQIPMSRRWWLLLIL